MDRNEFDAIAKKVAQGVDRRRFLGGLVGVAAAMGLGVKAADAAKGSVTAKPTTKTCAGTGGVCNPLKNRECCPGAVCVGGYCCHAAMACGDACCSSPSNGSGYCDTQTDEFGAIISQSCAYTCNDGFYDDGAGNCVECLEPAHCAGEDTECGIRTCEAGVCGWSFTAEGTPVSEQVAGDCLANVCDGAGGVKSIVDDTDAVQVSGDCLQHFCIDGTLSSGTDNTDVPDNNECQIGICGDSGPTWENMAEGTACGAESAGQCDANGTCIMPTPEPAPEPIDPGTPVPTEPAA